MLLQHFLIILVIKFDVFADQRKKVIKKIKITGQRDFVLPANDVGVLEVELSVEVVRVHLDGGVFRHVPDLDKKRLLISHS